MGLFLAECYGKITSNINRFYVNEWEARTSTYQFVIYRQIQQEYNANPLWT